ncbi:MAG: hypothetical protein KatS3mg115_1730 [Candidatus Poribacteria bacterium]|nr:MAG: hypothetical protein KatS3mg115_1730 [Candidatus Poribacteria bacterium]
MSAQREQGLRIEKRADLCFRRTPQRDLGLDLYLPVPLPSRPQPLIVWIHGGAWMGGDKDPCPFWHFAGEGFVVASISYRLSHEAIFPAQLEDCKAAIRWLRAHAGEYGIHPERIGVVGHSAGGHLAALVGVTGWTRQFDRGEHLEESSAVQAVCDMAGPTDFLQNDAHTFGPLADLPDSPWSLLIGGRISEHPDRVAQANPITYIRSECPPFLVIHGERDEIVPFHQSVLLVEALKGSGVPVEFLAFPEADHSLNIPGLDRKVLEFFRRELNQGAEEP